MPNPKINKNRRKGKKITNEKVMKGKIKSKLTYGYRYLAYYPNIIWPTVSQIPHRVSQISSVIDSFSKWVFFQMGILLIYEGRAAAGFQR